MDNEKPQRIRPLYFSVLKGLGVSAFALLLKWLVSFATFQRYAVTSAFGYLENYVIFIIVSISSLFVYNSSLGIAMTYDVAARDELMENSCDKLGEMPSFKKIFGYKSFLIETATITFVLALAAFFGGSPEIFGMFYLGEGKSPNSSGILPALVTMAIAFTLCVITRVEAVRYWKLLYRTANLEIIANKINLTIRVLIILVLYPIALPFLPIFAYIVMFAVGIIVAAATAMTVPVFIVAVIALIYGLWWLKVLFAIKRRKKFFERMKDAAAKMKFEVRDIKNIGSSFVFGKRRCTFTLVRKNEKYDCLVIGNPRYRVPVCFISESRGYYRHRLGTKKHNITLESRFEYSIPGDGRKILIISPTPKHAFICDGDKDRRIFTADKLWDFVVYEADGFVGALERDCLGRYDSYWS